MSCAYVTQNKKRPRSTFQMVEASRIIIASEWRKHKHEQQKKKL